MSASAPRYRLLRTIASGGMAHVYEAVAQGERGFERRVAIKRILPQHAADERMRQMFFDEATIASRLHHANIVQVLDFGVLDDDDFLVMEFVDGLDASRAVQLDGAGRPMPESLALHVVSEVAHALAYAHGLKGADGELLGIVHRDVSPHNVLLAWDGDVKLADFGIALAKDREHRTQAGLVKGKLAFMPPEQAAGGHLTGAVDVYALGATLHALATGAPPREHPHGVVRLDESLSEPFLALVEECTYDDPSGRPSAADVAERAGRLAHAGLDRDARGALQEWLASRREPTKRSALDDLMGMVLVPSEGGRRFTLSRIGVEPAAPAPPSEPEDPPRPSEVSMHLPVERGPRVLGALLLLAALGGLAGAAGWLTSDPEAPVTRGAVAPAAPDPVETPPPAPDPDVIPVAPTEPVAPTAPSAPPPRVHRRSLASETTTPSPPPEPAAEAAPAYLRIPRVGAGAERILIDGAARGFTPAVVRVTAGAHHVSLVDPDSGAVAFERDVSPGPQHTRLAPLVVAPR